MNLSRILAISLLLSGCAPAMRTAPAPSDQRKFIGSWKGMGEQSDEPGSWTIAATIAGGEPGNVIGTITYPSLSCGGDLVLRSASADSLVVDEHITFGSCVDGGIVTLGYRAPGYLAYSWRSESMSLTARGQLGPARP